MKTILHISADFPDPLVPAKTKAVANLLAATKGYRHVVYSLNRVSWQRGVRMLPFGEDRFAVAYGAPPYGVGLARFLEPVAAAIARHVEQAGRSPDAIHAHKFTVDGLIAAELGRRLGVPFIASVWGDTDCKIVNAKRSLRAAFRRVADQAEALLPAAPWTARYMEKVLGVPADKLQVLPVMTSADGIAAPVLSPGPRLISVFALDAWKRKGLDVLAEAMHHVSRKFPGCSLDIFGTGSPRALFEASNVIRKSPAGARITLRGALPSGDVQRVMNGYAAFVMAPRRETYGMVHAEAVLAGLPVLWAKDRGIDGLLDDGIGVRCDPHSPRDVADGIAYLLASQAPLKRQLAALQARGAFEHLRRSGISGAYAAVLSRITRSADSPRLSLVAAR